MGLSISSIESLLSNEYTQATAEVAAFVAWIKGKDSEVASASAEFAATIARQQALSAVLQKAGYSVAAGSLNPPAA